MWTKVLQIFHLNHLKSGVIVTVKLFSKPSTLITKRTVHSYVLKMDKAYFRHVLGQPTFDLSFKYQNPEIKLDRQFNFARQVQEPIKTFLDRVTVNVDKALNKKSKKKKQKVNNEETSGEHSSLTGATTTTVELLVNDQSVALDDVCENIFKQDINIILKINEIKYKVLVNSPWVEMVTLPKSMLAGFPTYPLKLEHIFTDLKNSELKWFKSKSRSNDTKNDWIPVGSGFVYEASNADIGYYLKFSILPKSGNLEGPQVEAISDNAVEAGPGLCPFENRHKFTMNKCEGKIFRVITYNILADLYCDSEFTRQELFPYCPPYALAIDYRKQLFLKEIIGYNGDLICLQEVDRKVFHYDLIPVLTNLGFNGVFSQKGAEVAEGVATFFDIKRFSLLDENTIELSKILASEPVLVDIWQAISRNEQLKARVLDRSTVLQLILLKSHDVENSLILVANTHLYFHPDADHIRLLQGAICIKLIEKAAKDFGSKYEGSTVKIVFCGDLNSSPDCGIYKLLTSGNVPEDFKDWSSNQEEKVTGLSLTRSIKMASACGIPPYTNFTAGFKDCLDWIYYDTENFEVDQVIPLPSLEEMNQHTALPSVVFPSDHVALVADLKFR